MKRNRAVNRRYGWLTIMTDKRKIKMIASRTLMAKDRWAMMYLHKGIYTDSITIEADKDRFQVGHRFQKGSVREYFGNTL